MSTGLCYRNLLLSALGGIALSACLTHPILRFGTGGRYLEGKDELTRRQGGNIDKAIQALESVAREEPTYRDTLTLLGRAYYKKGRYQDAFQILQRARAVNREDEIAWLVLGLAQMRLEDEQNGLASVQEGLALSNRVMKDGYRGYPGWDPNRLVNSTLRRAIFLATKGLEEKENLIRTAELLLTRIDDEEWYQKGDQRVERALNTSD